MSDYTDAQEEGCEVDHDFDNEYAMRKALNKYKSRVFFGGLLLAFSLFINAILIIQFKL